MSRGLMRSAALGAPDLGLALSVSSLVALGGTPPLASVMLGVVLLAQTAIGERTMRRARWWGETGWHERLLLRVVVGAVVATTVDQLARVALGPGPLASCAWWAVAAAAVAVPGRAATEAGGAPEVVWREWIWLAMVACVLLAHEVLWTAETAVALALVGVAAAGAVGARRMPTPLRLVLVATGVAVAWWGVERRPSMRLLPDDRFFARVVWSLGEWGFTTNPFVFGESLRYHWGSYAWLGLLSRASGSGAEAGVRTVGPLVVGLLCATGLVALARRCGARPAAAMVAAAVAAACDTYAITGRGRGFHIAWVESFSQFVSAPVLIASLLWLTRVLGRITRTDLLVVIAIISMTGAVKVSTVVVVVATVWATVLWSGWRRRRIFLLEWAMLAATTIAAAATFVAFSKPVGNTVLGTGVVRPYWPVGFIGDLWRWYVDSLTKWAVVMALLLAGLCIAIPMALASLHHVTDPVMARVLGATLLAGTGAGLVLTVLLPPSDNPFYALHNVTMVAWLVLGMSVARPPDGWSHTRRSVAWVCLGTLIGVVTMRADLELANPDRILWLYVVRPAFPAIVVSGAALLLRARTSSLKAQLAPVGAVLAAASATLGLLNWREQRGADYREWQRASIARVDPAQSALVTWIDSSQEIAVFAAASDVFQRPTSRRELIPLVTAVEGYGRVALQQQSHAAVTGPRCGGASALRDAGATFFVATAEEATVGALDACATRVYENASYVVYDLTKAP